jgi:transcriptional regulator with XRE-family HTH domain
MVEPVLPIDFSHLADNLRILRLAQRKTQRALSAKADLTQSYVCQLERHLWPSDPEHVDRLAKALGVEPERLLAKSVLLEALR